MTDAINNQTPLAAKQFAEKWAGKGYEKGESQRFWLELLQTVYGVANPYDYIRFEEQVRLDHTSFIDGYIPTTRVMIEQKSLDKKLGTPIKQSDGSLLSPFQQAKRYIVELPVDEHPRWVVTCNFAEFWVYDMNKPQGEPEKIRLDELERDYYRLQFLVNVKSDKIVREEELSVKAGEIVGRMYDALAKQYRDPESPLAMHSLNVLCVRLVFCLYAEDAGIFGSHTMFHDYLQEYNSREWRKKIIELFEILNTKEADRDPYLKEDNPSLAAFPYVNGGLFARTDDVEVPPFNDEIRTLLLEDASAGFNWADISPTIFGAVFESTLNPETRRTGGMHYTSIENIQKVIRPLFVDDLEAELAQILSEPMSVMRDRKLEQMQEKLSRLRFLDPACGSGNFLTESYILLRELENRLLRAHSPGALLMPMLSISQFYGIEINDFAVTVAKTAMWIAESQMLRQTEAIVGHRLDFLPLKTYTNIVEGNALRKDWATLEDEVQPNLFCQPDPNYKPEPKPTGEEHAVTYDYIMGNPPFVGARLMNKEQKEDIADIFKGWKNIGNLDYVACWYKKAAEMLNGTHTRCALVSTNSICQGEQVALLWKPLFQQNGIHIDFAYPTFIWDSESSLKAHVHCVIVGFSQAPNNKAKRIYEGDNYKDVANINGYLIDGPSVFIESRKQSVSNVPPMLFGSMPNDGGHLIIEEEEYDDFIKKEPKAVKWIRPLLGAEEFINDKKRYCLWLLGISPAELNSMPTVMKRVAAVRELRLASSREGTRKRADVPTQFGEIRQPESGNYLLVPSVSSERRKYVPMGFMSAETIASNLVLIVPNATLYEFGILTSNVHMAWMRAVCGRLESRYRYSKDIVYNNFPWPKVGEEQRAAIEKTAQAILDARALYPDSSLAELYNEVLMPVELRKAHQANDKAVMAAYGFSTSLTESQCVTALMQLWQEMTSR